MKKIIFIFAALNCFIFTTKGDNTTILQESVTTSEVLDSESNGTPDCVAGWKYVGTFEAIESAENPKRIEVRLYKNIMGDKSFKVVVERKKDVGFIFTRYEIYNECYTCTIDDGIAYFKIDNSLWAVSIPQN